MFHHGLFAASALIPMVNVPCPVSHDAWLMQVASRAFCSVVSGTDATAMVSAITGSRSATFTSANRACRMVLASAVWSTESAVIISPDATTELEFDDCAVVLEHPARSAAAAATAANHAPDPLRIPENFDLMLSPLTGTEGRHVFRPSPLGMLSQASRLSKRYWMDFSPCHVGWPGCSRADTSFRHLRAEYWNVGWQSPENKGVVATLHRGRLWSCTSVMASTLGERVRGDRDDQDRAVEHLPRRDGDVQQRCDVGEQGEEDSTEQRADEGPTAAGKRSTSKEHRSETRQRVGGTHGVGSDADLRAEKYAGDHRAECADNQSDRTHDTDPPADPSAGFGIETHAAHREACPTSEEPYLERDRDEGDDKECGGDEPEALTHGGTQPWRDVATWFRAYQDGNSLHDAEGGDRRNDRTHFECSDHDGVETADGHRHQEKQRYRDQ